MGVVEALLGRLRGRQRSPSGQVATDYAPALLVYALYIRDRLSIPQLVAPVDLSPLTPTVTPLGLHADDELIDEWKDYWSCLLENLSTAQIDPASWD